MRKFTKYPSNVTASTKPHPKIPAGWERVPEGDDDDGNWGTIAKALPDNQGYYWINVIEDDQGRRCFELEVGYRGDDDSIGQIWKAASKPFYRLGDIVKYADTKWRQLQNEYDEDIDACDKVVASTTGQTSDFTVIQEIYDDGYVYMTEENVEPVYTQEYDVNLAEVLTKYPEAEKYGLKGWTDESFKPGDIITKTHFAKYVEFTVGDEQMYSDFKDYVAQHPEFDRPARNIEVRINNPSCLPSGEEDRRKQSEELGKRLGEMLGLGRY